MAERTCTLCGEVMSFDSFTNAWVCSSCGSSISDKKEPSVVLPEPVNKPVSAAEPVDEIVSKDEDNKKPESVKPVVSSLLKEEMLSQALEAMREERYEKAAAILSELRKNRLYFAQTYILMLLCGYKVKSTAELLSKNAQNSSVMCKLGDKPDWNDLASALPEEQRKFVSLVIEYCAIEIVLSGNTKKVYKNSRKMNQARPSAFSKMDAEEEDAKDRLEKLKQAREAQYGQVIVDKLFDIAEAVMTASDEPLFSNDYNSFSYRPWSDDEEEYIEPTYQKEDYVAKQRARKAPSPLVAFVSVKSRINREELIARKPVILDAISELESQILSKK